MRHYCAEAVIYGDKSQPAQQPFGKVIVILNPIADRKSATETVCIWILTNFMGIPLEMTHLSMALFFKISF